MSVRTVFFAPGPGLIYLDVKQLNNNIIHVIYVNLSQVAHSCNTPYDFVYQIILAYLHACMLKLPLHSLPSKSNAFLMSFYFPLESLDFDLNSSGI